MSESTKKPEQAEENTTPETAPAEDTKKAEKKASKSSKKDRIAELEKSSKRLSSHSRRVPTTSCASRRNMITSASVRCARRMT